ncbi:MAG TPA: CpsB/CapC family capsule biosynthesis tyrosine phosphatase [Longimicrobium sp.]|jgi:protein-tyrosine phosphatase
MIDFHNHLVPGVDDGAADLAEARAGLAALVGQGVRTIVTTSHLPGSLTTRPARLAEVLAARDRAWETLRAAAAADFPGVRLERGHEVMLDVPVPDLSDPRVRLAGTAYALVEFPFFAVPPGSARVLAALAGRGWVPVVAHPERYSGLSAELDEAVEWKRAGAYLQINSGSVLGKYGPAPREAAWALLRAGLADFLSSDYHARGTPAVAACRAALEQAGGAEQARLLSEENPARLLAGRPPHPVPPLRADPRPLWKRFFGR